MIFSDSRYTDSKLITVEKEGKNVVVITPSDSKSFTFNYIFYTITGGDRLDLLASAFYNDPSQWWRITDANPEVIDWMFLETGRTIRIPNT